VESLGLSSYPPAYLSEEAQSNNKSLLHGANFASGGAGYLDGTAALSVSAFCTAPFTAPLRTHARSRFFTLSSVCSATPSTRCITY
jgi:hypothetical protein